MDVTRRILLTGASAAAGGLFSSDLTTSLGRTLNSEMTVDVQPTLNVDFSAGDTLPASWTFSRSGNGTYYESNGSIGTAGGNVARYDHLLGRSLLYEPAATNYVPRARQNTNWVFTNLTKASATIVFETAVSGIHRGGEAGFTFPNGGVISALIAQSTERNVYVNAGASGGCAATFDLNTGAVIEKNIGLSAGIDKAAPFSAFLVQIKGDPAYPYAPTGGFSVQVNLPGNVGDNSYLGVVGKGLTVRYVQVEAGPYATSLIETNGASATRNAESLTIPLPAGSHDVLVVFDDASSELFLNRSGNWLLPQNMHRGRIAKITAYAASADTDFAPAFARAAGASALIFKDDFDSAATIDNANTKAAGFKWYRGGWFGGPVLEADQYSVSGSVLTLGKGAGASKYVDIKTAIAAANADRYVGTAFSADDAIYFEARIKIDPTQSTAATTHFPAFWSLSLEHVKQDDSAHWDGQAAGYSRFPEPDFFEFVKSSGQSIVGRTSYDATIHDWSGIYSAGWPNDIYNRDGTAMDMGGAIDDQFHLYGCLIVKQQGSVPGYIQWMFDRRRASKRIYWLSAGPAAPPLPGQAVSPNKWLPQRPDQAAETYSITDRQRLVINLMTDSLMPMDIDWVKVWK